MITREQVVDEARAWIGTKYQHQASLKGVAVDCIGLIRGVARGVGIEDPFVSGKAREFEGYSQHPNPLLLTLACEEFMDRIKVAEAMLGDVLVFNFVDRQVPQPQHFGIISQTDPTYIIHSLAGHKVVEHHLNNVWAARILAAYRLRGVA
jgi:NlpC/P60 family putative phage cell wall peptidase